MRLGAHGPDVVAIQGRLVELGFMTSTAAAVHAGKFETMTDIAVRAFQRTRGLVPDGDVGPVTNIAIIPRCYPLRRLVDGRAPVITSRHSIHNPDRPNHNGVDFLYRYQVGDPPMKLGDGGRSTRWWVPPGNMAIAAAAGVVVNAGKSRTGYRLWIRHDGGQIATGYFHLRGLTAEVQIGARLELGVEVGEVGDNPADDDITHLHFELYRGEIASDVRAGLYPRGTMDPEMFLRGALVRAAA